jgi:hypothetical protein
VTVHYLYLNWPCGEGDKCTVTVIPPGKKMRREIYCGHLMGNAHEAAPSREGGQRRTADVRAGLRLSLTVSLILAFVCEMIAGLDGLGQWVLLAARWNKSADLFAGVMLLGAIGLVANSALSLAEGRLLRWRGASGG